MNQTSDTVRFDKESKSTDYDGRVGWFQLFSVFADPSVKTIEVQNIEYFEQCLTAFEYFVECDHLPILKPINFYDSKAIVYDYSKRPIWENQIKNRRKGKNLWITGSWMYKNEIDENLEGKRLEMINYRSMHQDLAPLINCFYENNNYTNLNQSRYFRNAEELIYKMKTVYDSKFYIGSTCSWSSWAKACGIPTYIFFNTDIKNKHKEEFLLEHLQL